ncbi:uncharacterized protein [Ambystoma mexicanum]|uniref:uncharacterized protein n=1 Tax=Ambystoma mexicanum TaxID=8296 RepID=UPI0037E780E2
MTNSEAVEDQSIQVTPANPPQARSVRCDKKTRSCVKVIPPIDPSANRSQLESIGCGDITPSNVLSSLKVVAPLDPMQAVVRARSPDYGYCTPPHTYSPTIPSSERYVDIPQNLEPALEVPGVPIAPYSENVIIIIDSPIKEPLGDFPALDPIQDTTRQQSLDCGDYSIPHTCLPTSPNSEQCADIFQNFKQVPLVPDIPTARASEPVIIIIDSPVKEPIVNPPIKEPVVNPPIKEPIIVNSDSHIKLACEEFVYASVICRLNDPPKPLDLSSTGPNGVNKRVCAVNNFHKLDNKPLSPRHTFKHVNTSAARVTVPCYKRGDTAKRLFEVDVLNSKKGKHLPGIQKKVNLGCQMYRLKQKGTKKALIDTRRGVCKAKHLLFKIKSKTNVLAQDYTKQSLKNKARAVPNQLTIPITVLRTGLGPGKSTNGIDVMTPPSTIGYGLEDVHTPPKPVDIPHLPVKGTKALRLKWLRSRRQRKMFLKRLKKAKAIITRCAKKDLELHSPDTPDTSDTETVFLQSLGTYHHDIPKYKSVEYYEVFRFMNLDRITSTGHALLLITESVERLVSHILESAGPNDFVQIRLDSSTLNRPLFTRRTHRQVFDVLEFLENIGRLLQSKAELLVTEPLRIVTVIVRSREGGVYRPLKKTLYSMIVAKKKRWLLDFNYGDLNICMAASIIGLLEPRTVTDGYIQRKALEVHQTLGMPPDVMVGFNEVCLFEDYFGVPIKILYNEDRIWKYFPQGDTSNKNTVYLLHHEKHYYGILNLQGFLGVKNVCPFCCHIYNNRMAHKCRLHCHMCQRDGCLVLDESKFKCPKCKTFARSEQCLKKHIEKAAQGLAQCYLKADCVSCGRFINANHECRGNICPRCKIEVVSLEDHLCYMTVPKDVAKTEDYIVFDIECMQETGIHVPNYVYAKHLTGDKTWSFYGIDCIKRFITNFLDEKFRGYSFLAHNSQGYDSFFLIHEMIKERVAVKLVMHGAKLKLLEVIPFKIRFIDSLNFLPMKLSKWPKAFGFPGSKGYFPHFFNTQQNQNYVGPIPPVECYGSEFMMSEEKEAFLKWYSEARKDVFDFKRELKRYCREDVNILRTACNIFRSGIIELTQKEHILKPNTPEELKYVTYVDPFTFITLASMCMHIYKQLFLEPETIALVPIDLYHGKQKRFSTPSIQWLMYLSHQDGIPIQHALRGGEKKIGLYFLDGYACLNGEELAYEFNGCFFHGCPRCYKENDYNTMMGCTNDHLHRRTLLKKNFLENKGLRVITLWEHEWTDMLKIMRG